MELEDLKPKDARINGPKRRKTPRVDLLLEDLEHTGGFSLTLLAPSSSLSCCSALPAIALSCITEKGTPKELPTTANLLKITSYPPTTALTLRPALLSGAEGNTNLEDSTFATGGKPG